MLASKEQAKLVLGVRSGHPTQRDLLLEVIVDIFHLNGDRHMITEDVCVIEGMKMTDGETMVKSMNEGRKGFRKVEMPQ
jgi:hypothetical protein